MLVLSIILIILLLIIFLIKNKKQKGGKKIEKYNQMLNIYNEPLKKCGLKGMSNGSWDSEGKCSELGGGVHQICIQNISKKTPKFSKKTGQSNWSDKRGNDNHCVCLGAWSLYNAKNKNFDKDVLKCDAIPKVALSDRYVNKFSQGWNKWNGLELDNQIKDGVEALVNNCYNPKQKKSKELKKNYCSFAKKHKVLQNSQLYKDLC
tara:strand:+ start:3838 stop:4452 length:615 start_codon:yes stop_codon:yes gene_type:complete